MSYSRIDNLPSSIPQWIADNKCTYKMKCCSCRLDFKLVINCIIIIDVVLSPIVIIFVTHLMCLMFYQLRLLLRTHTLMQETARFERKGKLYYHFHEPVKELQH